MVFQISKTQTREKQIKTLIETFNIHSDSNAFIISSLSEEKLKKRFEESHSSELWLKGNFCAIKDLISNTDGVVSGGSSFLKNYTPPYNATVYKTLKDHGAINVVNANLDEFGLGGTGLSNFQGPVVNPVSPEFISGGSSSGSGYLLSKQLIDFSVVSDTGDSSRQPASYCGVFGFKPSYGKISRYGFYPFCSGFDTPSIMANDFTTLVKVFCSLSFSDIRDLRTLNNKPMNFDHILDSSIDQDIRIAVLEDTFWRYPKSTDSYEEIKKNFEYLIEKLKLQKGIKVSYYSFSKRLLQLCELIYAVVASVESISNYSNLTGLLFPFSKTNEDLKILNIDNGKNFNEILFNNRKSFGNEFVFRQVMGRHFIEGDNYEKIYLKCKKILSLINNEVSKLFGMYDLIISPTTDDIPQKINNYKRKYSPSNIKNILLLGNFCSLPAISIPWIKVQDMPVGLHIMAENQNDAFLLKFVNKLIKFSEDSAWN